ncbi:dihydroorotase family protein [bacterium]|nr:dihydroorotase family protein [bacterium]
MRGLLRIEGMLDPHTHLRDLDWRHKATFASETAAALAGGYTAVFDMPNTPPTTTTPEALRLKQASFSAQAVCDWGIYFGAAQSDNTSAYPHVAAQTCGLKIFNNATTGDLLLTDQAERYKHYAAWPSSKLIAVHAEDETVSEILALVRQYRTPTHFLHICTAYEISLLRAAKAEGLPVTIGVCPHHLYLTETDEARLGGYGLMKPGLKTPADQAALWEALQEGLIDVIESDHAPHTIEEKESSKPPFGVPGLETTLPLMLLAIQEGRLTLEQVPALLADTPRRIWGVPCPPDTYTLVDFDADYILTRDMLHSACGWSPFEGMRLRGRVVETWIRGVKVFDGERVLVPPGFGVDLFGAEAGA